ncbi:MAG: hypothetical protein U0P30_03055 [Vicinamibacterales bacterium]
MTDDGIGRLLVASLHQSIGDVLPQRLEYYEHWLSPMGLKEGRSGLAPLNAVLSFLRQEGQAPYDQVMATAGRYSAEWHFQDAGAAPWLRVLPRPLRRRAALRRSRALLVAAFASHRVKTSVRKATGTVTITGSVFCGVRDRWPWPTCAYLASSVTRLLELQGLSAEVRVASCRAQGEAACTLTVNFEPATPEAA